MTETYTCPYCNAQFPRGQAAAMARGPSCPRCLEPLVAETGITATPRRVEVGITAIPTLTRSAVKPVAANRKVGLIVVSVMIAMAALGLGYALWTTPFRRANDKKVATVTPRTLRAPTELAGLGYLPEGCTIVAGIQFIEIEDDPLARKLFAKPRPVFLDLALAQLDGWTGSKVEELDHIIVGANTDPKALSVTMVVASRKIFDLAELAKVHGDKIGEHHGKPVFAFQPLVLPKDLDLPPILKNAEAVLKKFDGRIWCPDPQVLVLALRLKQPKVAGQKGLAMLLDDLPLPPGKLNADIQNVLNQRLDKHSIAWFAGHGDWRAQLGLLEFIMPREAKIAGELKLLKSFGLSLSTENADSPDGAFKLIGQLSSGDEADTRSLAGFLKQRVGEAPGLVVVEAPADLHGPDACWISLQQRFKLAELRSFLGVAGNHQQ